MVGYPVVYRNRDQGNGKYLPSSKFARAEPMCTKIVESSKEPVLVKDIMKYEASLRALPIAQRYWHGASRALLF